MTPGGPRADGPQRPAPERGRRRAGRQPPPAVAKRRPLRAVQLLPAAAAASTRSGPPTSPTCRGPSRPALGSAPASRPRGSSSRASARSGSRASGVAWHQNGSPDRAGAPTATAPGGRTSCAPAGRSSSPAARSARRSCCCARGSARPAGCSGATCASTPPAGSGARFDEEVRGWDGVMQSYAVDEWQDRGILLEATFTPLAFGAQWLPGTGAEHQRADPRLRPHRIDRRPPLRPLDRAGRPRRRRLAADHLRADRATTPRKLAFGIARAVELFYAAGAKRGLPPDRRHPDDRPRRHRRAGRLAPIRAAAAAGGVPPDGHRADGRLARARRRRHRRRRPRRRGPLRRRRLAAAELDRRQPDDDHHRDGLPRLAPAGRHACRERRRPPEGGRRHNLSSPGRCPGASPTLPGPRGGGGRRGRRAVEAGRCGATADRRPADRRTRRPPPASPSSRRRPRRRPRSGRGTRRCRGRCRRRNHRRRRRAG